MRAVSDGIPILMPAVISEHVPVGADLDHLDQEGLTEFIHAVEHQFE